MLLLLCPLGSDAVLGQSVKSAEVVPTTIYSAEDQRFEWRVRLRDHNGRLIPEVTRDLSGAVIGTSLIQPTWVCLSSSTGDSCTVINRFRFRARVSAPSLPTGTATTEQTLAVQASAEGKFKDAWLGVLSSKPADPFLLADHVNFSPPEVALTSPDDTWGADKLAIVPFVGLGPAGQSATKTVGQMTDNPQGQVALFSVDTEPTLKQIAWLNGVPAGLQNLPAPTVMPVVVWILSDDPDVAEQAERDVKLAAQLFLRNRAGMKFELADDSLRVGDSQTVSGEVCLDHSDVTGPNFSGGIVNVLYASSSYKRGFACKRDDSRGEIIVITPDNQSPTTLAHELGHVLNLRESAGHTDEMDEQLGFESINILWSGLDDLIAVSRRHLSVGQIFHVNYDSVSAVHRWLKDHGDSTQGTVRPSPDASKRACDQAAVCPPLGLDIFGTAPPLLVILDADK